MMKVVRKAKRKILGKSKYKYIKNIEENDKIIIITKKGICYYFLFICFKKKRYYKKEVMFL